jgi:hypothetical protein
MIDSPRGDERARIENRQSRQVGLLYIDGRTVENNPQATIRAILAPSRKGATREENGRKEEGASPVLNRWSAIHGSPENPPEALDTLPLTALQC